MKWINVQEKGLPNPPPNHYHAERTDTYIVAVSEWQYPHSPYDEVDSPTERRFVDVATYNDTQKVWIVGRDYGLIVNALIDPEDIIEGFTVTDWMPWPKLPGGDKQ